MPAVSQPRDRILPGDSDAKRDNFVTIRGELFPVAA